MWKLHLTSLHDFTPYFFAHDQLNYACLTPLYLATITELEQKDEASWKYLEDNYSISKTPIPFVAIGSDHALEQENKTMKVLGAVVGLTQQPAALNRFCSTTPILSQLSQEFLQRNNVGVYNRKYHYQLTGSTCDRIHINATNIEKMLETFSVGFQSSNAVVNLVSKAVLPSTSANELLDHKNIGLSMYQNFISERINGLTSVWSPMKKRNLKTFKTQVKTFKYKVGKKLIQLKEEKSLMSRFLITARKSKIFYLGTIFREDTYSTVDAN